MKPDYKPLCYWVKERERIRMRKERGVERDKWTADEILSTYRFCNVRREDDRVTLWIKREVRDRYEDHPYLWLMLCICRQINWPETLRELIDRGAWPTDEKFKPRHLGAVLNERKRRGSKVYTGAYMIAAPSTKGADKQMYMAQTVIGEQWDRRDFFEAMFANEPTLREVHTELMEVNGWGKFMSYQAVVDMRFTDLLRRAKDRNTWAAAGPGTIRGLNRIYGRHIDFNLSQEQALKEMRPIHKYVMDKTGVMMDFSDVPNILCETDKYLRVKNGEGKPRALYEPNWKYA